MTTLPPESRRDASSRPRLTLRHLIAGAAVLAALLLLLLRPAWLPPDSVRAGALVVAVIGLWASAALPEHVTALLFFLGAMLLRVAPPAVIFSGFASPAWWLVLGGLLIGLAVEQTGLGRRLANRLLRRAAASYLGAVAGLVGVSLILGFLMPSALGRSVLMIPIALALAEQLGFQPGSNGRTALVTAAAFGSYTPTFTILTANVPNMILLGSATTLYGHAPGYGRYLLLHFPVLGLLKSAVMVLLIVRLFPDRPRARAEAAPAMGRMSSRERLLSLVLLVTLLLWMTDFLHHISPGWVALAAGIFCVLPVSGILPRGVFNDQVNFASLLFVAGVLGLGAMVAHTGLGAFFSNSLLALLPLRHGAPLQDLVSLVAGAMFLGPVTTTAGVPALLTPLAGKIAALTGLPLRSVLMSMVPGISTTLLPYQAPPLIVAFGLAGEPVGRVLKFFLLLAAVTILVLLPLDLCWWRLLGWW